MMILSHFLLLYHKHNFYYLIRPQLPHSDYNDIFFYTSLTSTIILKRTPLLTQRNRNQSTRSRKIRCPFSTLSFTSSHVSNTITSFFRPRTCLIFLPLIECHCLLCRLSINDVLTIYCVQDNEEGRINNVWSSNEDL